LPKYFGNAGAVGWKQPGSRLESGRGWA